jgi:dTDP-4-amino-4,6-dideoxygalactose transaminase
VTFVATANVVIHNRLKPVFVDVDPDTYNIDPGKIEDKISTRTRAIIPVHLLGLPADMPKITLVQIRNRSAWPRGGITGRAS